MVVDNNLFVRRIDNGNDDFMGIVVNGEEEAYQSYNEYAMRIGLSVRKAKSRYCIGTKQICQKEVWYSRQGHYEGNLMETRHYNRFDTRTGCEAMTRLTVKDSVWTVTIFILGQNHELVLLEENHLLRSNRALTVPKANIIETMVNAGISTKNVYAYMSKKVSGSEYVGFTKKRLL